MAIIRHVAYVMLFKSHDNGILNACVLSACRRTKDGKVTASGEWIQSSTHAPEPHAVHAARRAPRCRTHRHPVTGQSAASPASAGTGSGRAGSQGQPEYDQHGSPREVSLLSPSFLGSSRRVGSDEKPQAVALSRATIFRKLCFLAAGNIFINFLPEVYEPGTSRAPDEMVIGEATVSRRRAEGKLSFACASQKNYTAPSSVLRFQFCTCFRANRRLIRKLDLSVLSASRRSLWPVRPKEYRL